MLIAKRYRRLFYISIIVLVVASFLGLSKVAYSIDSERALNNKEPIFSINNVMALDGGTTIYSCLGYQVIKWNRLTARVYGEENITGVEVGYEVHKYHDYRDINDGPTKELKFISDEGDEYEPTGAYSKWGEQSDGIKSMIYSPKSKWNVGENIELRVKLKNISSEVVSINSAPYHTVNMSRNGVPFADAIGEEKLTTENTIVINPNEVKEYLLIYVSTKEGTGIYEFKGGLDKVLLPTLSVQVLDKTK